MASARSRSRSTASPICAAAADNKPILGAGKRASVVGQQQRTDAAVADPHGHQVHVVARIQLAASAARCAPSGRVRRAGPSMDPDHSASRAPPPLRGRAGPAAPTLSPAPKRLRFAAGRQTSTARAVQVQLGAKPVGDRRQGRVDLAFAEQPDDVVQHNGLALALLCLERSLALARRQLAGDGRRQQEEQQRDPLLRVADGELVMRLDKEPVENQEGRDRSEDRLGRVRTGLPWPAPPANTASTRWPG